MKKIIHTSHIKQKGFTLLFAVLVSTLVISISATIISIALRQTILSGTSRESQYAFYSANTALECARYWDRKGAIDTTTGKVVFPVTDPQLDEQGINSSDAVANTVTCSDINLLTGENEEGDVITQVWDRDSSTDTTTFYLKIKDKGSKKPLDSENKEYCAQATVTKEIVGTLVQTTIEAKGYNTCDTTNPRRVERGLIEQYSS